MVVLLDASIVYSLCSNTSRLSLPASSGFVMLSYQSEGYSLPHNAGAQFATFAANEVWMSEVQPGDMLFYYSGDVENDCGTGIGHVAMYIGNGETLEAGDTTNGRRWLADKAAYVTK